MTKDEFEHQMSNQLSKIDNKSEPHFSVIKAIELLNDNRNLVSNKIYYDSLEDIVLNCTAILNNSVKDFLQINENYFNEKPRTYDFSSRKIAYNYAFNFMLVQEISESTRKEVNKSQEAFVMALVAKNKGCYIATMAYGDYDHSQVMELRKFRDNLLSKTIIGRSFIKFYYRYSPSLVNKLKNKQSINLIIRKGLDQFIKAIKKV